MYVNKHIFRQQKPVSSGRNEGEGGNYQSYMIIIPADTNQIAIGYH
jgi:hypothetical protein